MLKFFEIFLYQSNILTFRLHGSDIGWILFIEGGELSLNFFQWIVEKFARLVEFVVHGQPWFTAIVQVLEWS